MLEVDRQAKRIEMLEETVKRKDKDIEILKTDLLRYTKALLNLAEYVLPQRLGNKRNYKNRLEDNE